MNITFHHGDTRTSIRFAIQECWLGQCLVAASERGVCAILLGDDADALTNALQRRVATADLAGDDHALASIANQVVDFISTSSLGLETPLDVRGTAFQILVWKALCEIPTGSTASYSDIAQRIDRPQAVRAVAQACGANPLAVVIPCHRVVCQDGSLSGYRWGVQRKKQLLRREQQLQLLSGEFSMDQSSAAINCTASTMT